jgi:hypothetical protein
MKEISIISFIRTGGVYGPMKKGDKKTFISVSLLSFSFIYISAPPMYRHEEQKPLIMSNSMTTATRRRAAA